MPSLYNTVKDLSEKLSINTPLILIFKGSFLNLIPKHWGSDFQCNAFAMSMYHNLGLVCIGDDLIKGLSDAELEAVIAHELGHISNNHIPKQFLLTPMINILIQLFLIDYLVSLGLIDITVASYIQALLGLISQRLLSRFQEKEADLCAASVIHDPLEIAKALEKTEMIFRKKSHVIIDLITRFMPTYLSHPLWNVINDFVMTHPPIKDRKKYLAQAAHDKHSKTRQEILAERN